MAGITIQEEIVVKGVVSQEELQVPFRVGVDGVTFTPSVSAEGVISWTNDGDKENPTPVNIKGQQGDNVEFRTSGGFVQWKPTSGITWTNLISIAELAQLETTTGQSTTKGMTQKAITDALALKVSRADIDYLRYSDRVALDSGTIRDKVMLKAMYDDALNLLPNTDLWFNFECGIKTRISGLNTYVSKVYDLSTNNRDATQTTEASQPYLVGNINPANRYALWGNSRFMTFNPITYSATDKWSVCLVADIGSSLMFLRSATTLLGNTGFKNESSSLVSYTKGFSKNTTQRIYFIAKGDSTLQIWVNGVISGTISNPTNVVFNTIMNATSGFGEGRIKSVRILNKDLNKSEIEFLDAKMAAYYPPFEGVTIGNQVWEASNAMDIVAPDGTAIPEVQPNDTASATELITNAADREFTSDTGFWTKTAQVTIGDGVCNIKSTDGSFQGISKIGIPTEGKLLQVKYTIVANRAGTLKMSSGTSVQVIDSTIGVGKTAYIYAQANSISIARNSGVADIDIDDISIKESGWADRQAVYDYYISVGKSVNEALSAASAWCYYNNSEANGAIYGRQYNNYAVVKLTGSPIWRAPMKLDFDQLATFLGGTSVAGGKLKASGLTYWNSPNTGATNESGFSGTAGGLRNADGTFSGLATTLALWSNTLDTANNYFGATISNSAASVSIASADAKIGRSLRRLRRIPSGDLVREITSGVFTTNITGGTFKDIAVPNMYRITGVKVTSAQALTNFTLEARTAAGVLVQNLLSGKSIGAGKSIIFSVVADMEVMLQDYVARATAVGNGGAGMEIELIIEKIKV